MTRDSQTYREVYNGELPNPIGVKQVGLFNRAVVEAAAAAAAELAIITAATEHQQQQQD